jgi:hypothetical protein
VDASLMQSGVHGGGIHIVGSAANSVMADLALSG